MRTFLFLLIPFLLGSGAVLTPASATSKVKLLTISASDSLTFSEQTERLRIAKILQPKFDPADSILILPCSWQIAEEHGVDRVCYDYIAGYVTLANEFLHEIRNSRFSEKQIFPTNQTSSPFQVMAESLTDASIPQKLEQLVLMTYVFPADTVMVLNISLEDAVQIGIEERSYEGVEKLLEGINQFIRSMKENAPELGPSPVQFPVEPICLFSSSIEGLGPIYDREAFDLYSQKMRTLTDRMLAM